MRLIAIALLLPMAGPCLAAEPFARVAIEEKGPIVPGQQVRLDVTVFAPDFFTSPPQFLLFDLPNAVVTLPDERAQNSSETVDGIQYSGISRVYAIVPETSGDFSLPPVPIELGYSAEGKPVKGEARMPAFGFTVGKAVDPSANTLAFAASGLTLTQSFDRDPASLKVGDTLVRTVTVFAEDTQAMMIPAVNLGDVAGVKQYASTPVIRDNVSVDRQSGAERVQTVTYTIDTVGSFVIPKVSYEWYDIDAKSLSTASLSPTRLTFEAGLKVAQGIAPQLVPPAKAYRGWSPPWMAGLCAAFIAISGYIAWHLRAALSGRALTWMSRSRDTDRRALECLVTIIRTREPNEIEAGLRSWSRRKGFRSLSDWTADRPALRIQVEALQQNLYSDDTQDANIDRNALARAVVVSERKVRATRSSGSHLPALNPGFSTARPTTVE